MRLSSDGACFGRVAVVMVAIDRQVDAFLVVVVMVVVKDPLS